jgi:hypothetical protein
MNLQKQGEEKRFCQPPGMIVLEQRVRGKDRKKKIRTANLMYYYRKNRRIVDADERERRHRLPSPERLVQKKR